MARKKRPELTRKEQLESAIAQIQEEVASKRAEVQQLAGALERAQGMGGENATWIAKRHLRGAEAARDKAQAELEELLAKLRHLEEQHSEVMAELERLGADETQQFLAAAAKLVAERGKELRRRQEEDEKIAREIIALYRAAESKAGRCINQKRSSRFLRVRLEEPFRADCWKDTDPPYTIHLEFFKALLGERETPPRWRILEGQDLKDPGEVEIVWRDAALPAEFNFVKEMELGRLVQLNGGPPSEMERQTFDFPTLDTLVREADVARAVESVEKIIEEVGR